MDSQKQLIQYMELWSAQKKETTTDFVILKISGKRKNWGLYGSRCIEFLGGEKLVRPFLVAYSFVSIIGATINLGLLWDIADTFNGLMAIPNLIALLILSGQVKKLAIDVDQAEKSGTL